MPIKAALYKKGKSKADNYNIDPQVSCEGDFKWDDKNQK